MLFQQQINLIPHLNSTGATFDHNRSQGGVNAWGNSLPAEEIPFGEIVEVGGLRFLLPRQVNGFDHLESLCQEITLPAGPPIAGLAVPAFGEMGPQRLDLTLMDRGKSLAALSLLAPGWLVPEGPPEGAGLVCSHLHYPGDYDLARLRPVLWVVRGLLPASLSATSLRLGFNPFFHVFGMTLFRESGDE